jgi:hypothetical protein
MTSAYQGVDPSQSMSDRIDEDGRYDEYFIGPTARRIRDAYSSMMRFASVALRSSVLNSVVIDARDAFGATAFSVTLSESKNKEANIPVIYSILIKCSVTYY